MSTLGGLPAHILLVHAVVVLAPLTALLVIGAGVWAAMRRRLVWLILALAVIVVALTPLTTSAGEWLQKRVPDSAAVRTHAELGDSMLVVAVALLFVAVLIAVAHLRESRGTHPASWQKIVLAVVAVVIGVASIVQVVRIGDTGASAVWDGAVVAAASAVGGR